MLHFIKHLLQLIISPVNGWEDISHKGTDAKRLATEGLYPLLGITAISTFIRFFYDDDLTLINLIGKGKYYVIALFNGDGVLGLLNAEYDFNVIPNAKLGSNTLNVNG